MLPQGALQHQGGAFVQGVHREVQRRESLVAREELHEGQDRGAAIVAVGANPGVGEADRAQGLVVDDASSKNLENLGIERVPPEVQVPQGSVADNASHDVATVDLPETRFYEPHVGYFLVVGDCSPQTLVLPHANGHARQVEHLQVPKGVLQELGAHLDGWFPQAAAPVQLQRLQAALVLAGYGLQQAARGLVAQPRILAKIHGLKDVSLRQSLGQSQGVTVPEASATQI
mmetsp:Transcript_158563/g.508694  ORF Transcript_158563/g.508694 Transcript_158563/m.508694 type:complete len:230 (-) Transcript_158563:199-888(-)